MLRTVPALIPCILFTLPQWARRESNPRPGPYKRPALTTELRAASGAEGPRTLACRIKSSVCCRRPCCARCPHDPRMLVGRIRFNRVWSMRLLLISSGSRPCCARCPESNSAPLGYQPGSGNRPSTTICELSQRALLTQWVGRCSNPPLLVFSQALYRLSYRPKRKKPDVVVTPGFGYFFREQLRPDVTCAMDRTGAYSPNDRRSSLSILAVRNSAVLKSWPFLAMGSSTRAVYLYSIV